VQVSSCTATLIGAVDDYILDIAVTPNGTLWGMNYSRIFKIDTLTAISSESVATAMQIDNSLVALNDTTLIVNVLGANPLTSTDLYKISTKTGAMTLIGTVGSIATGDLAWYNNDLYLAGAGLIKIELNNTASAITNTTVIPYSNPMILNYGMETVFFPGNKKYFVGNYFGDLVKICPLTGACLTICDDIVPEKISGMGTVRLPVQPPLTECDFYAGLESLSEKKEFFTLAPNPSNLKTELISASNMKDCIVRLIDLDGNLENEFSHIKDNKINLSTANLIPGVYLLQIISRAKYYTIKLIVEQH
jgi:hypothetical protein